MLSDLFDQFVKERQYLKDVTPKTLTWYRTAFKAFQTAVGESVSTSADKGPFPLTKARLQVFIVHLRGRRVGARSCNTYLQDLNAFAKWLHDEGHASERVRLPLLRAEKRIGTAQWTAQAWEDLTRSYPAAPWLAQSLGNPARPVRPAVLVPPWSAPPRAILIRSHSISGFLSADTPALRLPAPSATLVEATTTDAGRALKVHLTPAGPGHKLFALAAGPKVLDATVDGQRGVPGIARNPCTGNWGLAFHNAPASGIDFTLRCEGRAPLTLVVLDRITGLPSSPRTLPARPGDTVRFQDGDETIVRRTYTF